MLFFREGRGGVPANEGNIESVYEQKGNKGTK
jgi:hypothetical protein